MSASQARIAYRRLLKAEKLRFANDPTVLLAARQQTRTEFETHRDQTDAKKLAKLLKHAASVEEVIRRYVVQAPRNDLKPNTYNVRFTADHALRDAHPIIIKSSLQNPKQPKE